MLAGPNLLLVFQADAVAAEAGPVALPAGNCDAPADPWVPAAVPGAVAPVPGVAGAEVPGSAGDGAAGAGEPGVCVGSVDGAAAPPVRDGEGVSDGGMVPSDGDGAGDVGVVGDGEGEAGSVVGEGDGAGWVRYPGRVGSPVPGSGESEGSGFGRRTTDATASSKGTPASTEVVASVVVSGAGTRDTALDAGTPADRTSTAPSAAAAVPRRRPPWKPVSVRVSSDF